MEKKFWWFSKKNEPASDFEDYSNDYYGDTMREEKADGREESPYSSYSDSDISDVSVVLSGDPSRDKEPIMKRTFTPLSCDDSAAIVDAFKDERVVVICVEELDKPNFLRLFDYVMGAVQALDGELKRVDRDTVVLLPYGVKDDISIDELEEAEAPEDDEDSEDLD